MIVCVHLFISNVSQKVAIVTKNNNKKRIEKRTPVNVYLHDCEPIGLTFIPFNRDVFGSGNSCVCSHFVYMNSVCGPIYLVYNSRI